MIWSSGRHPCPWWWCDVIMMHVSSASRKVVQTWSRDAGRPSSSATCGIGAICALVPHEHLSSLPIKPPTTRRHGVCSQSKLLNRSYRINFAGTLRGKPSTATFSGHVHSLVRFVLLNYNSNAFCYPYTIVTLPSHTGRGLVVLTMNSAGRRFEPYQVRASCRSWPRCASKRAGIQRCNQCSVVPQNEPLVMLRPFFRIIRLGLAFPPPSP